MCLLSQVLGSNMIHSPILTKVPHTDAVVPVQAPVYPVGEFWLLGVSEWGDQWPMSGPNCNGSTQTCTSDIIGTSPSWSLLVDQAHERGIGCSMYQHPAVLLGLICPSPFHHSLPSPTLTPQAYLPDPVDVPASTLREGSIIAGPHNAGPQSSTKLGRIKSIKWV